jgi:hypothetical protein
MDNNFSIIFDLLIHYNGTDNIYLIFFVLNFIFAAIAFQLGFAKKLSPLKTVIVYIMLAVGIYVITIFSILKLPITESLIIISLVLGIYRFRLHKDRQRKAQNG